MQQIFDPKCSPADYQKQGKLFLFPDLTKELCPQCEATYLKPHGYYTRWLCDIDFDGAIIIRRHICKVCGKTVSLLPRFAHPGVGYGIRFIHSILSRFYSVKISVANIIRTFQEDTDASCSRQLLRDFRKRFEKNLNRLIMEVTGLFEPELPLVTSPENNKWQRARQFLECIQSFDPEDVSLKLFKRSRTTYLTARAI
jgi:ribosomal protein S27AE